MLDKKQILEIREHLERAQNPLFYYDNDADGLCSFVLLRKFIDRGKGVAVRSFPGLNASYARKAQELKSDYVFVLDKPVLSREFVEEVDKLGLPLVWIDHHEISVKSRTFDSHESSGHDVEGEDFKKEFSNLYIYNPTKGKDKSEEPVTYWCYKITERKENVWLAVIGCIADHYLPDFVSEFKRRYGDFWGAEIKKPFDAYYGTEIGKIAQGLNFGLKDSISNVVRLQNFLIACRNPMEVFEEGSGNYAFRKKYSEIKKKYDVLIEEARKKIYGDLIFFDYSGDLSISADLANELSHEFPEKYVAVAYRKGAAVNLSLRGNNVRRFFEKVLEEIEGSGGGHEDAVGGRISASDLGRFKDFLKREIEK